METSKLIRAACGWPASAAKPGLVAIVMFVLVAMGAVPLRAGSVPMEQGYPLDSVLYVEVDFSGGVRSLLDFPRFASAGAMGVSYEDMVESLRPLLQVKDEETMPLSSVDAEALFQGFTRVSMGLIDITLGGPTWTSVIEHKNPRVFMDILEALSDSKSLILEEQKDIKDFEVWTVKAPEQWLGSLQYLINPRRFFWGMRNDIDSYTAPIYFSIWNNEYIVLSSRKNDLLDALEYYDFAEETEETLAGNRAFRDFRRDTKGQDIALFWNLSSTITKAERIATANEAFDEYSAQIYSIVELKQFRSFTAALKYNDVSGSVTSSFRLTFFNRPSWVEVLPFTPKPTALASFCPRKPASFTSMSVDSPTEVWKRIDKLVKDKCEAIGRAEDYQEMQAGLKRFAEEQGFSLDELLGHLGSEHALLTIAPFLEDGVKRRGAGAAMVVQVADGAKAEEFIEEKLLKSEGAREYFHVKERAFVDTAARGRIGYRVFSSDTPDSFAWLILDGHLVAGNQDAVRAVITARVSGVNLANDPDWGAFEPKLPAAGLMTSYSDFSYLGEHADAMFKGSDSMSFDPDFEYSKVEAEAPSDPSEQSLASKVFSRHLPNIRYGSRIVLDGNTVDLIQHIEGVPTAGEFAAMIVTMTRHAAWEASQKHLAGVLVPEVSAWIMRNGGLPESPESFVAGGGDGTVFRDPMLAGPAVRTPGPEHCFVWLGKHEGRELLPALPLVHSRQASEKGKYLLAMSDGSVHRVTKEQLDSAVAAAADPAATPPFKSPHPQTLKDLLPSLKGRTD